MKNRSGNANTQDEKEKYEDEEYPVLSPRLEAFFRCSWIAVLTLCIIGMSVLGIKLYREVNAQQAGNKTGAAHLKKITEQAIQYYEDKYDKSAIVKENGYVRVQSMTEKALSDIYVVLEDGATILYIEETKQFSDDGQAGVISDQITEKVLQDLLQETKKACDFKAKDMVIEDIEVNIYGKGTNKEGQFFHAYYEGDIAQFLSEETVTLLGTQLYVLCAREEDTAAFMNCLQEKMQDTFGGFSDSEIAVCFLSEESYQKYLDGQYRKPDVGMEECYASYVIGRKEETYVQHYVKAAKGIYVTSAVPDLVLEEGDIVFEETKEITDKTINEQLLQNFKQASAETDQEQSKQPAVYSQMIVRTPVYRLSCSEKMKAYLQDKTNLELAVYVKFVPEEAGIENPLKQEIDDGTVELSKTTKVVRDQLGKTIEAGKEAGQEDKKVLWQRCRLYYFEGTKDYRCKDLAADLSDAERMVVEQEGENVYFGGYEILCENADDKK